MAKRKFDRIEITPELKRWYNSSKRGSEITADVNLRRLEAFCSIVKIDPHGMLEMPDKELTDLIDDFVTKMENNKFTPNYISSILKGVKSWLAYNNKSLTRKIKVSDAGIPKTLKNETVPTQEELKRIFQAGDPRERACSILMAHSGLRPESIGDYKGDDGLTVGDIPEMEITNGEVKFTKIPAIVNVRGEISKTGKPYITFLGDEGCSYLKAYLEERLRSGENLTKDSPLIVASKSKLRTGFIRTINISDIVRMPIRKAGLSMRPYVLRGFFDTQLLIAESKIGLPRDYRVFWMGHSGSMESKYTTDKKLPADVLEDMREKYAKSLKFLQTESKGLSDEDKQSLEKTLTATVLQKIFGYSKEEADKLMELSDDDLQKELQKKLGNAMDPESVRKKALQDYKDISKKKTKQVMIPIDYVDVYFEQGFEFVSAIGQDRAIMRLP